MMIMLRNCLILVIFLLPGMALATPLSPFNHRATYHFTWGAIPLGQLVMGVDENGSDYRMQVEVTLSGLLNIFTQHQSKTDVLGTKSVNTPAYHPLRYHSAYSTRKKPKEIRLDYSKSGDMRASYIPIDANDDRPTIPANILRNVADPLSGMMILRQGIHDAVENNQKMLEFPIYEGRQLSQLKATVYGRERIKINGNKMDSIHVGLRRTPLGGYKPKELKKLAKKAEPELHIYFSDDALFVPLSMHIMLYGGKVEGITDAF